MIKTTVTPLDISTVLDFKARTNKEVSAESLNMLAIASANNGIKTINTSLGECTGYIAFARINKEAVRRMMRIGLPPSFLYEFNEGHIIFVLYLCLDPTKCIDSRRKMRRHFKRTRVFCYFRKDYFVIVAHKNRKVVYMKKFRQEIKQG
jgi:hypothetical protein